jgi:thiol-disulfide isomerase/thioredoxin
MKYSWQTGCLALIALALIATPFVLGSGESEPDRRRLDAAKSLHAQEIERATQTYRSAVGRANSTLQRTYENVIRTYERRGDEQIVASLKQELEELLTREAPPEVAASEAPGHEKLMGMIGSDLVRADGSKVPLRSLRDKDHVLLYFSAQWCPPCRAFTPSLVEFYDKNRSSEKFELIFVSNDRSPADMQKYMSEYNMSFPAIAYAQRNAVREYGGRGIPNLVILNKQGEVVSGSYEGDKYVGPQKVLKDMQRLLAMGS